MSNKLIATDLDGTLFYPKHRVHLISRRYVKFLRKRIDLGDKVVVVSGRNYSYADKVAERIERPVDCVSCNGAYIRANNEILNDQVLGKNIYEAFEKIKKQFDFKCSLVMSEKYNMLINPGKYKGLGRFGLWLYCKLQGVYAENFQILDSAAEEDELKYGKVYKLMLIFGLGRKAKKNAIRAAQFIKENYSEIEAAYSDIVVEITPANCIKSEGLKKICDYYGFTKEDTFVIGDSGNDIPMFDTFYENSFCMAHAGEHIRCHAKHVLRRVHVLDKYLD